MEFWHEIAFFLSISLKFFLFSCSLRSLNSLKKNEFLIFEQSNPKSSFLHNKTGFFMLIELFMQGIYFCLLNSIIWQKEDCLPYFEWLWKFNDQSWIYHWKIVEFYFVFSVRWIICPWLLKMAIVDIVTLELPFLDSWRRPYVTFCACWTQVSDHCPLGDLFGSNQTSSPLPLSAAIYGDSALSTVPRSDYKNLEWLFGADWKFHHEGTCSASRGLPSDAKQLSRVTKFHSAPKQPW